MVMIRGVACGRKGSAHPKRKTMLGVWAFGLANGPGVTTGLVARNRSKRSSSILRRLRLDVLVFWTTQVTQQVSATWSWRIEGAVSTQRHPQRERQPREQSSLPAVKGRDGSARSLLIHNAFVSLCDAASDQSELDET